MRTVRHSATRQHSGAIVASQRVLLACLLFPGRQRVPQEGLEAARQVVGAASQRAQSRRREGDRGTHEENRAGNSAEGGQKSHTRTRAGEEGKAAVHTRSTATHALRSCHSLCAVSLSSPIPCPSIVLLIPSPLALPMQLMSLRRAHRLLPLPLRPASPRRATATRPPSKQREPMRAAV